jgi:hypothetical protein
VHGELTNKGGSKEELPPWYVNYLKIKGIEPSYMATKKAFYESHPNYFCCSFGFCHSLLFFLFLEFK